MRDIQCQIIDAYLPVNRPRPFASYEGACLLFTSSEAKRGLGYAVAPVSDSDSPGNWRLGCSKCWDYTEELEMLSGEMCLN